MCEIDGEVVRVCRELMPSAVRRRVRRPARTRRLRRTARRSSPSTTSTFDAILVDSAGPRRRRPTVLFSEEFYAACRRALVPGGVLRLADRLADVPGATSSTARSATCARLSRPSRPTSAFVPTYPGVLWSYTSATDGDAGVGGVRRRCRRRACARGDLDALLHAGACTRAAFALPAFVARPCVKPPHPHPFLAAEHGPPSADADALILGLATDGGVSFRPGPCEAPPAIRAFSESIETWSPRAQRDLEDLRIVDLGDHDERESVEKVVAEVLDGLGRARRRAAAAVDRGRPLGDAAGRPRRGRASRGPRGRRFRRAPRPARGLSGRSRVHVPAHRRRAASRASSSAPGRARAPSGRTSRRCLSYCDAVARDAGRGSRSARGTAGLRDARHRRARPGRRAGDGQPGGRGAGVRELLEALEALAGLDVVACDVVEVSPPLDPSGITQAAAAILVREMLLRFAVRP